MDFTAHASKLVESPKTRRSRSATLRSAPRTFCSGCCGRTASVHRSCSTSRLTPSRSATTSAVGKAVPRFGECHAGPPRSWCLPAGRNPNRRDKQERAIGSLRYRQPASTSDCVRGTAARSWLETMAAELAPRGGAVITGRRGGPCSRLSGGPRGAPAAVGRHWWVRPVEGCRTS